MTDYGVSVQQLNDLLSDENGHFCTPSRDFDQVYPRILLGNESVATNIKLLHQLRVTHVLNVAEGDSYMHVNTGVEYYNGTDIIYHGIPANDVEYFDLSVYFEEGAEFIAQALAYKGDRGKVYVHCQKGYSRSAAVVIAYLMLRRKLDVILRLEELLDAEGYANEWRSTELFFRQGCRGELPPEVKMIKQDRPLFKQYPLGGCGPMQLMHYFKSNLTNILSGGVFVVSAGGGVIRLLQRPPASLVKQECSEPKQREISERLRRLSLGPGRKGKNQRKRQKRARARRNDQEKIDKTCLILKAALTLAERLKELHQPCCCKGRRLAIVRPQAPNDYPQQKH